MNYKSECPKSKKGRSKGRRKEEKKDRKAFKATWDHSSESESSSSNEEEEKANFCLMAKGEKNSSSTDEKVCLKAKGTSSQWFLDSRCSRHMTRDATLFSSLKAKKHGGNVTFGDGSKEKIVGIGNVENPSKLMFEDVLFVSGLSYKLLSISQLIDKGYMVAFEGSAGGSKGKKIAED
ncbi:uncharacterized protein LOC127812740 [Diospyros lotus]|uniref:uncharacterized protein LOC127812740 n=1 Tax=Diospyros lotus TaxID=55363 RepID=UPI002255756B|nr:uncharacterized protein LOC127812740 [Diospyros lotus]